MPGGRLGPHVSRRGACACKCSPLTCTCKCMRMCKRSIGGSGFVGQNLVAQLLKRQTARVLVFDCAAVPLAPALPSRRGQRRELYRAGDVEDAEGLLAVMRDFDRFFSRLSTLCCLPCSMKLIIASNNLSFMAYVFRVF